MSARRQFAALGSRLFRPQQYRITQSLFLAALGLIYFCAFASLAPQVVGLYGSRGIAPLATSLANYREMFGPSVVYSMPSLFWLGVTNNALQGVCVAGCLAAVFLLLGWAPIICNFICWALYLSLVSVGAPFTNFQWDALLLETGFLALWMGSPYLVWGFRFLLFRLMFESGLVKLTSGDVNWHSWDALRYHFYTQPLPMPLAYYAAHMPNAALRFFTAATLAIELFVPFLLFLPRPLRLVGTALLALLQVAILLTGNYGFFNLLTLALCIWGLDDQALRFFGGAERFRPHWDFSHRLFWRVTGSVAVVGLCVFGLLDVTGWRALAGVRKQMAPLELVNSYGLFANMTTARNEIVLQGSDDAENWQDYEFRFKPGDTKRELPVVTPHMPRLDWQMWFAALGTYPESRWMGGLMYRLLTGEPSVRMLLAPNRGPKQKPKYLRALLYSYRFTDPEMRRRTGEIWHRELAGTWYGPVSLTGR